MTLRKLPRTCGKEPAPGSQHPQQQGGSAQQMCQRCVSSWAMAAQAAHGWWVCHLCVCPVDRGSWPSRYTPAYQALSGLWVPGSGVAGRARGPPPGADPVGWAHPLPRPPVRNPAGPSCQGRRVLVSPALSGGPGIPCPHRDPEWGAESQVGRCRSEAPSESACAVVLLTAGLSLAGRW